MGSTVEIRAQIDTETVRGLQLMNGGSAAALASALPIVLQNPGLQTLASWMIWAIVFGSLGMAAAIYHNRLRRKCSLLHDDRSAWGLPYKGLMGKFATEPGEPRVCTRSVMWMYASFALFIGVVAAVATGAGKTLGRDISPTFTCWELKEVNGLVYKHNTCTGTVEYQELPTAKPAPSVGNNGHRWPKDL